MKGSKRRRVEEAGTQEALEDDDGGAQSLAVLDATRTLLDDLQQLRFSAPVLCVYNVFDYAWDPHQQYVGKWGRGKKKIMFMGMNPGPFGMAQTGVPFGDVHYVRDWVGVVANVGKPAREHPKRPVHGFDIQRREKSGQRFWGLMEAVFGPAPLGPQRFFDVAFVYNYCPLAFMAAGGANITPDKIKAPEREPLFAACDRALVAIVDALEPEYVVGIGKFAEGRARAALCTRTNVKIHAIPHPSPANPRANLCWEADARQQLVALHCFETNPFAK